MKNSINRELPDFIDGYGKVKPFKGAYAGNLDGLNYVGRLAKNHRPRDSKVLKDLKEAFRTIPVKDGMTLGFHHALRDGDYVINMVLDVAADLGIKDLTVAASGLMPVHEPIIDHMKNGVVTGLDTAGVVGPVGQAISRGALEKPAIFRSHGGRPRALSCGDLKIDVAFIAASASDRYGNINGFQGPSAFGSLGYAMPDSEHADHVVVVTDNLMDHPLSSLSIRQDKVDYVVCVDKIGDPSGIQTGMMKITKDPLQLLIAETASKVSDALGIIKEGFSFQTGGGGVSLAYTQFITEIMKERGITANHAMGGITGLIVDLHEKGMLRAIYDNQCFDIRAAQSIAKNPGHFEVSADMYANPFNRCPIVNTLDQCILGALEIDTNFNLNVLTGSNGVIRTGIGGNQDTAAGSNVTMVVANLLRGRIPVVVDNVTTVCTPGETVDVLVTEDGVAVNPLRQDLLEKIKDAGIKVVEIEDLKAQAEELAGKPLSPKFTDRIVGVVENRDGTVLDVIYQVSE